MDIAATTLELTRYGAPGTEKEKQEKLRSHFIDRIFSVHQESAKLRKETLLGSACRALKNGLISETSINNIEELINFLIHIDLPKEVAESIFSALALRLQNLPYQDSPELVKMVAESQVKQGKSYHAVAKAHHIEPVTEPMYALQAYVLKELAFKAVLDGATCAQAAKRFDLDYSSLDSLQLMVVKKHASNLVLKGKKYWKVAKYLGIEDSRNAMKELMKIVVYGPAYEQLRKRKNFDEVARNLRIKPLSEPWWVMFDMWEVCVLHRVSSPQRRRSIGQIDQIYRAKNQFDELRRKIDENYRSQLDEPSVNKSRNN